MEIICWISQIQSTGLPSIILLTVQPWQGWKEEQGSNLTFELNSQMASTCSGFTSHKRVSSSLGTSVQHKILKKCQKSCGYQTLIKTAT